MFRLAQDLLLTEMVCQMLPSLSVPASTPPALYPPLSAFPHLIDCRNFCLNYLAMFVKNPKGTQQED